ncbi:NAD(P)-binding protein [Aspergillus granulosus]|uniref:NAD(P)-binding protein n=1 Tax=Aspergillus granulosus TaxID=176169 RepID=A0ABR4H7Y2_9EURO
MPTQTVIFITGVRQGIGLGLLQAYLARPNHTVIGSVRNPDKNPELESLPKATGSSLLLVTISNTSPTDPGIALQRIQSSGITHIDAFIANAGGSPPVKPLDEVTPEDLTYAFQTNAASALLFFQTFQHLLKAAERPRWISVTSEAGSLGLMGSLKTYIVPAYGASKAALNWFTLAMHHKHPWLTAVALQPGHVKTEPGNWVAREIGLEEAPTTVEESVSKIINVVDTATRETVSGKYIDAITGKELPR